MQTAAGLAVKPNPPADDRRLRWVTTNTTAEERRRWSQLGNVSEAYLYQCLTNRRDMNPQKAREVEEATNREVTRKQLCQETWAGIWPELASAAQEPALSGAPND